MTSPHGSPTGRAQRELADAMARLAEIDPDAHADVLAQFRQDRNYTQAQYKGSAAFVRGLIERIERGTA